MSDTSQKLFERYARHYQTMEVHERLPDELERLRRDRLPCWIDEIPKDARMLDAGCAQGHLLEALRRVGFTNLIGFDLSAESLAAARMRLPDWVHLEQQDVREFLRLAPPESFDTVFFHDVLEHLPRESTLEVLKGFHQLLAPGGRLSLRVPNMGCLIAGYTMSIDFTHITHFSEYSLLQVLEASGFNPEHVSFECQAPRLFWSWRKPHRALLRLLNRGRWHLNNAVHRALYALVDFLPPKVFDPNLLVQAHK